MTTRKTAAKTAPKKQPLRKASPARARPARPGAPVTHEERWRMIADAAYYRASRRDFAGGDATADWLEAEQEVDARLRAEGRSPAGSS